MPLRTRRALSLYALYSGSALLVHNRTYSNIVNALLALNRQYMNAWIDGVIMNRGNYQRKNIKYTCTVKNRKITSYCTSLASRVWFIMLTKDKTMLFFITEICSYLCNTSTVLAFCIMPVTVTIPICEADILECSTEVYEYYRLKFVCNNSEHET